MGEGGVRIYAIKNRSTGVPPVPLSWGFLPKLGANCKMGWVISVEQNVSWQKKADNKTKEMGGKTGAHFKHTTFRVKTLVRKREENRTASENAGAGSSWSKLFGWIQNPSGWGFPPPSREAPAEAHRGHVGPRVPHGGGVGGTRHRRVTQNDRRCGWGHRRGVLRMPKPS